MTANNNFSISRFSYLIRKELVEHWKAHTLQLVAIFAGLLIFSLWTSYTIYSDFANHLTYTDSYYTYCTLHHSDPQWAMQGRLFYIALFAFGCYSASLITNDLRRVGKRISVLTTPVTPLENWLSRWTIYTILFLIMFLITFIVSDYLRVLIYKLLYPSLSNILLPCGFHQCHDFFIKVPTRIFNFLFLYMFVQSFYVMGSSFFPRQSFLKTTFIGFLMGATFVFIVVYITSPYSIDPNTALLNISLAVFAIIMWALAYYRFKDIEIIDRY